MHYRRPSKLSLSLAVALSFGTAHAQQVSSTTNKEADEALRQKAFDLLESIAGQLGMLQSPENRARLGANLAESLWEKDERRARTLLMSVQEDINAGLRNQEGDQTADAQRRMVFLQLRVNTVERIAKHDGELALAFFKATESPPEETLGTDYAERALELNLAKQVAANNPEVALGLARQSLAKGFHYEVINLLRQLNRKHPEQALTLYGEIVAKLKRTDLSRDQNAFYFAQNLAGSFSPPATDDSAFRDLRQIFINTAAANGCDQKTPPAREDVRTYLCAEIRSLTGSMARVDPARTVNDGYPYEELEEVAAEGNIDSILALVARYPRYERDIYRRAVFQAQAAGDLDRARRLANDYRGDPATRQWLLLLVEELDKVNSRLREQLKDIQATLDTMPRVEGKIDFLMRAAMAIAASDQKQALKLIDQAAGLIDSMTPGKSQLEFQLGVAIVYCWQKDSRGIAMMDSLVPRLNELVNAAARLDGYENNHLRDGEWNMANEGALGSLLTALARNAPYFAWCDFDRAVSVAGQFDRPEIRLMAQVKLAQGILAGKPKPLPVSLPARSDYVIVDRN
jgi:hypothetical protein